MYMKNTLKWNLFFEMSYTRNKILFIIINLMYSKNMRNLHLNQFIIEPWIDKKDASNLDK